MFSPNSLLLLAYMLSHIPNVVSLPSHPAAWTSLQNITIAARQEHTTFFLPPSTIGILGGIVPNGTAYSNTDLMQFYSLPRDTWETAAPIPKPLNHVNVAVANGKIYLLGGLANALDGGSWQAIPDSWVYDPKKNAWEEIDAMPTAEARGSATMGVYEGKIFLAGGMRTLVLRQDWLQDTVDTVSVYDTTNGKWIAVPDAAKKMPEGRDHAGGAVIGDKMYVLGGRNRGQLNVRDTVFILNLCNLQAGWTTSKAKLPTPRGGLAAGVIGKKVYTFGGEGNLEVESGVFNQTEVYDTVTDSWERLGPMKVPRHGTSAVGVENKVYIPGGGVLIGGGPVATFDAFVP